MNIGLGRFAAAGLFGVLGAIAGCAQDVEPEQDVDPAALDALGTEASISGETYTINCGSTLPGLPQPRCVPDLVFNPETAVEVVKPGEVLAPGHYVTFGFKNNSKKAAGAFTVKVTDQYGATVKTVSYAGLAPYASSMISFHAPYACGWSRTVTLDADDQIDEDIESNNSKTYAYWCTRK